MSCDPADLLSGVALGLTPAQRAQVKTELMRRIAETSDSAGDLLSAATCYLCLTASQRNQIQTELLCRRSEA